PGLADPSLAGKLLNPSRALAGGIAPVPGRPEVSGSQRGDHEHTDQHAEHTDATSIAYDHRVCPPRAIVAHCTRLRERLSRPKPSQSRARPPDSEMADRRCGRNQTFCANGVSGTADAILRRSSCATGSA